MISTYEMNSVERCYLTEKSETADSRNTIDPAAQDVAAVGCLTTPMEPAMLCKSAMIRIGE